MKITLSIDGIPRGNLTIKFRVSREDLVNAVGWKITRERLSFEGNVAMIVKSELRAFNNARSILIAFKEATISTGNSIWSWSDGIDSKVCEEIRLQADILVRRKFPGFVVKA